MTDRKEKKIVLVVDDSVSNLKNAEEVLKEKYTLALVKSGRMALNYLENNTPDLILLDVMMPELDGFETIKRIKANPDTAKIPVIFLTVDSNVQTEIEGFRLGALDFIKKPFEPEIMIYRIEAIIELDSLRKKLEGQVNKKTRQLEIATLQVITCVADIVDNRTPYTKGHSVRVAGYAEEIARRLGLSDSEVYNIHYISLLHDVGKLISPYEELDKPATEMTEEELSVMYKHCIAGADLLREFTIFDNISDGAAYHHERYDGKGGISGFVGEEIPLVARIIAVANAYDNMKSFKSYRKPYTDNEVKAFFEDERGKGFDPQIIDIMLEMLESGYELTSSVLNDGDITGFGNAILHKVITEYTDEIKIEAQRDALTGLWDRKYTEAAVNEYLERESNMGVMYMIDMDNFKQINDTYGHIVGDEVLVAFAEIINTCCDENDIVCRIGGDEFTVFHKGRPIDGNPMTKADSIIKAVNDNEVLSGFSASISIGIAVAPNDGISFTELYGNSDKALYYVKQNGKGGAHFYSDVEAMFGLNKEGCTTMADLEFIKSMFEDKEKSEGALQVEYNSFKNIYHFIERCISRTQQNVELVLFTLSKPQGELPDVIELKQASEVFNKSVCGNIRRGDVFTSFSSSQFVVILINVNEHFGVQVAERIKACYYAARGGLNVDLSYDLQPIQAK
jgi:putative two-component system response regulator